MKFTMLEFKRELVNKCAEEVRSYLWRNNASILQVRPSKTDCVSEVIIAFTDDTNLKISIKCEEVPPDEDGETEAKQGNE